MTNTPKNQNTHRNNLYFDVAKGFCFFYKNDILKETFFWHISASSVERILKLSTNSDFHYEPFSTVIYLRRKSASGF